MKKILLLTLLSLMLIGIVSAQSNTIFTENGLSANTVWNVNVYSIQNANFNRNFNTSSNSITTNIIPSGSIYPYFFVASAPSEPLITGIVNVGSANPIRFSTSSTTNSITTVLYQFCSQFGISTATFVACETEDGAPPNNASSLQSQVIGPPFAANLTIYINQEGYYEYVINNGTSTVSPSLYENIQPGELVLPQINLTGTSNQKKLNSSYIGSIFYSQQIDISPIEYDQIQANLTPYNFFYWVEQNSPAFYNTTLVYQISNNSILKGVVLVTTSIPTTLIDLGGCAIENSFPVLGILTNTLGANCLKTGNAVKAAAESLINGEVSVPVTTSIPIALDGIPSSTRNYNFYVTYAYPNLNCLSEVINGICTQSGTQGMLAFNNYVDNTYAPQVAESQFMNTSVPILLILTLSLFIIKKMNGD